MEFDIQKFLAEMRVENRTDRSEILDKIEIGFIDIRKRAEGIATDLAVHERADIVAQGLLESRLKGIESIVSNMKWFTRVGIIAFITFLFDILLQILKSK